MSCKMKTKNVAVILVAVTLVAVTLVIVTVSAIFFDKNLFSFYLPWKKIKTEIFSTF